ncbi:MAG: DUF488 domain-containing protein [Gemmatimonadetes bacterium]|nr:DUF488 domain-containing protein [Gemmatimonadota bacterium]
MKSIATIGYEEATVGSFLEELRRAGIDLIVDVRAAARSRRPGFAKTSLRANLEKAGIGYIHINTLGTPADGRAAARSGEHEEMRAIFREHLGTTSAQSGLESVLELVESGRSVCLLCLEANPEHCHRSLVAEALAAKRPLAIRHLRPED